MLNKKENPVGWADEKEMILNDLLVGVREQLKELKPHERVNYMNKLKDDPKSAVLLTGYQVENSNARLLMGKARLDFYGVIEKIECEVVYFDFSAHAGHSELIDFAKKCNPEKIVLMHSDDREALIEPLRDVAEIYTPNTGEIVEL